MGRDFCASRGLKQRHKCEFTAIMDVILETDKNKLPIARRTMIGFSTGELDLRENRL
jgi:hypothetical protein